MATTQSLDVQSVETDRSADHVHDRVKRANLVKVNAIDRLIVHLSFRSCESCKDLDCTLLHASRQPRRFNDLFDIGKVAVFVLFRSLHSPVSRAQPVAVYSLEVDAEPLDVKQRQLSTQVIRIYTRADHGAEYHVAARTGETVEVKSLHLENKGNTSPDL